MTDMTDVVAPLTLNAAQRRVVAEIAATEVRSPEQMLSLLLSEGIRFYYCDYTPPRALPEFNPEELYTELDTDAARLVGLASSSSSSSGCHD